MVAFKILFFFLISPLLVLCFICLFQRVEQLTKLIEFPIKNKGYSRDDQLTVYDVFVLVLSKAP